MSSHHHCRCAHNPSSAAATMLVREEDTNTIALNSMADIALILLLLLWNVRGREICHRYVLCVIRSLTTGMMREKTTVDTSHQLLTVGLLL